MFPHVAQGSQQLSDPDSFLVREFQMPLLRQ
jgi:hypothetical protein